MYNIFFGSRRLVVCDSFKQSMGDANAVLYTAGEFSDFSFLPDFFDQASEIRSLYVPVSGAGAEDEKTHMLDKFGGLDYVDEMDGLSEMSELGDVDDPDVGRGHDGGAEYSTEDEGIAQGSIFGSSQKVAGVVEADSFVQDEAVDRKLYGAPSADFSGKQNLFDKMFSGLNRIDAGGGLVTNARGEFLLIFRYGKWDLPKGTREPGERLDVTALREVEEECGVQELQICKYLCDTFHTFRRDGLFNLKCTRWYHMRYTGDSDKTVPQLSESIEKVEWVSPDNLQAYLSDIYPNILEVFAACC